MISRIGTEDSVLPFLFLILWRFIMALSARNQLKGKVTDIKKGMVMAEVTVEVASGVEIVAAITTSSVERLGLAVGKEAQVVIKATSVMLNA
jgi:molybdopterin-binding protein